MLHTEKDLTNSLLMETCCSLWYGARLVCVCVVTEIQPACVYVCVCSDELLDSHNSSSDLADVMEQINNSFPACSRKFPTPPPPRPRLPPLPQRLSSLWRQICALPQGSWSAEKIAHITVFILHPTQGKFMCSAPDVWIRQVLFSPCTAIQGMILFHYIIIIS